MDGIEVLIALETFGTMSETAWYIAHRALSLPS
jgi:hypothetical protein